MIEEAKKYLRTHSGTIFTLCLLVLLDHIVLGGVLRKKIQDVAERLLDGAQKRLVASTDKSE